LQSSQVVAEMYFDSRQTMLVDELAAALQ